jgi:hypothetical protein
MALAPSKPGDTSYCMSTPPPEHFPLFNPPLNSQLFRHTTACLRLSSPDTQAHSSSSHVHLHVISSLDTIPPCRPTTADMQETFILSQPRIWWDMYHDRPTFSLVKWSEEDVDEYRGGLETKEGVHAVSPRSFLTSYFILFSPLFQPPPSLVLPHFGQNPVTLHCSNPDHSHSAQVQIKGYISSALVNDRRVS